MYIQIHSVYTQINSVYIYVYIDKQCLYIYVYIDKKCIYIKINSVHAAAYIHIYTHYYIYVHIHIYIHTYTHYLSIYTYIYTVFIYIYKLFIYIYMYIYIDKQCQRDRRIDGRLQSAEINNYRFKNSRIDIQIALLKFHTIIYLSIASKNPKSRKNIIIKKCYFPTTRRRE